MKKFTLQQLSDWKEYEQVRLSGHYNMWFPQARAATRLSRKRYLFCLTNYVELREASRKRKKDNK